MSLRAKMTLQGVVPQMWGGAQAIFHCQYDPSIKEDQSFQKATPSGQASFQIDNPEAFKQLVIGKSYYFDISEVPAPAPVEQPVEAAAPAAVPEPQA